MGQTPAAAVAGACLGVVPLLVPQVEFVEPAELQLSERPPRTVRQKSSEIDNLQSETTKEHSIAFDHPSCG
jgi:hypothetical protein